MSDCRGQCYDGAANMSGSKSGVAMQFRSEETRATFIHCYGHALNLYSNCRHCEEKHKPSRCS